MATAHVNDVFIGASTPLLQVDATAASKVSLSVTTQIAAATDASLKVKLQGSNDQASWHTLGGDGEQNVGNAVTKPVLGTVDGFLWVRAFFTFTSGTTPLISASINTGN